MSWELRPVKNFSMASPQLAAARSLAQQLASTNPSPAATGGHRPAPSPT